MDCDTITMTLALNTGKEVQSTKIVFCFHDKQEAVGLFGALKDGQEITCYPKDLRFYDRDFKVAGRSAAQYRPISKYGTDGA